MNPDVYAAWLTAGAWLAAHWTGLAAYGIGIAALTAVAWALWPGGDDYRSRNDRKQAARTVARDDRRGLGQPGTDVGLYLDCVAIYGDCDELDRLREAIDQHRKENPL